jgi:peptide/nickel transport system substrate-binding protein
VRYALNTNSEASRLVNGREVTADDVIYTLNLATKDTRHVLYTTNPELRTANITKTGPREVTVKLPLTALITGISRFGDTMPIVPPEVYQKYGNMGSWKNSVGAGPFMLTDYVPGSQIVFTRNPRFWMTDPVGPGKGNQLPYIDGWRMLIIPDLSTRRAALRTAKIDRQDGETGVSWEEIDQFRRNCPGIKELEIIAGGGFAIKFVVDEPPFNDVRVRRAMLMAIDFQAINKSLYGGKGRILTYPYGFQKGYEALYVDFKDPDFPESARELYSYSPEKAKQILKEAGYPNGFKTTALVTSDEVDSYSVYKDMWSKIGVELALDVKESGAKQTIIRQGTVKGMSSNGGNPVAVFYTNPDQTQGSTTNPGRINDPKINTMMDNIRKAAVKDMSEAMKLTRELIIYSYDQAFAVPRSSGPAYRLWLPWIKNYSGEHSIGYGNPELWLMYIWLDQDLKKSLGY